MSLYLCGCCHSARKFDLWSDTCKLLQYIKMPVLLLFVVLDGFGGSWELTERVCASPSGPHVVLFPLIPAINSWPVFRSEGHGKLTVFSVKAMLATMCGGKILDKLRCEYPQSHPLVRRLFPLLAARVPWWWFRELPGLLIQRRPPEAQLLCWACAPGPGALCYLCRSLGCLQCFAWQTSAPLSGTATASLLPCPLL